MRKHVKKLMLICTFLIIMSASRLETKAQTISGGISAILDEKKTTEEYLSAAESETDYLLGYKNLGIANVDNHLNVRQEPSTDAKLVGKMSRNAGCEILEIDGDWAHIVSGDVEGYCHMDYLLTGGRAVVRANDVVSMMARATDGGLRVRSAPDTDSEIITTMGEGESLEVISVLDGWIKVSIDAEEAYISAEYAVIENELDTAVTMTELLYGEGVSNVRVDLCQYAKEFIGNPYVWGGSSLTNGTDCSGFTMSVFKKYGIKLPHSSVAQSKMGTGISLAEAKPGDLVFYDSGGAVNHVAIYIGNGQVVHASNPKQGIKTSSVGYRHIHCIRSIITN